MKALRHWFRNNRPQPSALPAGKREAPCPFYKTYQVLSSASVETLWQTLINLADMSSWHPLINSTNVPQGLVAKPGLIYRVIPRWLPIPIRIFVERVAPHEMMSVRLFPMPGLEERVIYQLRSTMVGTQISYSITLRGWLSPLAWSVVKPYAAQVAAAIAKAAEDATGQTLPPKKSSFEAW
ncbi:MAG TPA: hypothetical protein V6D02_14380 [Candidatus Obscuribacterales bacterium]